MDWSDELQDGMGTFCAFQPLVVDCDDHTCPANLWSCGDGQCVNTFVRHVYQKFFPKDTGCYSMREYNHICETAVDSTYWTKQDGLCARYGHQDNISLALSTKDDKCIYLIRCALSKGAEADCPCNGVDCGTRMQDICQHDKMYPYPQRGIIRPWILHSYDWNQNWDNPTPNHNQVLGGIRCRGFHSKITLTQNLSYSYFDLQSIIGRLIIEPFICTFVELEYQNRTSQFQYSETCWDDSFTFNGLPYAFHDICNAARECISQYRIGDGLLDCIQNEDEDSRLLSVTNYCHNIQKHRLQCAPYQMTCLSAMQLAAYANQNLGCKNNYDRFIKGNGRPLIDILCTTDKHYSECHLLRYYIGNSSIRNSTFTDDQNGRRNAHQISAVIPFRFHCDTFWNDQSAHTDENIAACQEWVCREDQFQCRTGQCIELSWVCDSEWDCSDASDEFGLLGNWSDHNEHVPGLNERKEKCKENYAALPFFDFCDFDYEYPCFRISVPQPLNIHMYRPCINLTQIGDGIEDCYGGLDEKNTLKDCQEGMLGYTLRCGDQCTPYALACQKMHACATSLLCSYRSENSSWCSGYKDVVCLNGTCVQNARCDGNHQCLHGEDEHWCQQRDSLTERMLYRYAKAQNKLWSTPTFVLSYFPRPNNRYVEMKNSTSLVQGFQSQLHTMSHFGSDQHAYLKSVRAESPRQPLNQFLYVCNRGFPIHNPVTEAVHCVCPSTYHGRWCQFFSDRLSVVTHLDMTTFPSSHFASVLTVVVTLRFADSVVDHHLFHANPSLETKNYVKQRFYLLYSRSNSSLKHKHWRYFNRTDISNHHPYSVHFDIFSLTGNSTSELGSFHYSIYFDFLPAFRLATILRFPQWFGNSTLDPCAQNSCNLNSFCKPILNRNRSFYCSCKPGYSGENCEKYHPQCSSYCASDSICRPKYRGLIGNPGHPVCICSLGRFGSRCNLRNEACKSNPCGTNSVCHLTYDPSMENPMICMCSGNFYGNRCQYEKVAIIIQMNMSRSVAASVTQFYDILLPSMSLDVLHQEVVRGLPQTIRYDHGRITAPILAVLKTHEETNYPKYFILYVQPNKAIINITSTPAQCLHASELLRKGTIIHK